MVRLLLLLFLLIGLSAPGWGAPLALPASGAAELAGYLERLDSTVQGLGIETVAAGRAGRFVPLPGHLYEGVGKRREVWLRFQLRSEGHPAEGVLRILPPLLDTVELYQATDQGWQVLRGGDTVPVAEWSVAERAVTFPVRLAAGEQHTFYLRVTQAGLLNAYFEYFSADLYPQVHQRESLGFGLFYGLFAALILINLLQWATLGDGLIGELALYLTVRALFFLGLNGLLYLHIPHAPVVHSQIVQTLFAWTIVTHVLLITHLLQVRDGYPRIQRLFQAIIVLVSILSVTVWFDLFTRLMGLILFIVLLVGPLSAYVAFDQVRRRRPLGRPLLAVMLVVIACQWVTVLPGLGVHFSMWLDLYSAQMSSVIIALAAHLAVALRVREFKYSRIASEEKARLALDQAEQERAARREQADFVAMLFHELKTPLAEIASAATVLEYLDDGSRLETGERYDTIHAAVTRLNGLVEQSLSRDRQGLDADHLERIPVQLQTLAAEVVGGFHTARDHRLVLRGTDPLPPLLGDPELLRIALANLIDNAIKYTPNGSLIRVEVSRGAGVQRLCVTDSGPGMDAEAMSRAFDRFWRGNPDSGAMGAGLGLYLVRKIVRAHGGEVRLESSRGQGCRFTAELPEGAA